MQPATITRELVSTTNDQQKAKVTVTFNANVVTIDVEEKPFANINIADGYIGIYPTAPQESDEPPNNRSLLSLLTFHWEIDKEARPEERWTCRVIDGDGEEVYCAGGNDFEGGSPLANDEKSLKTKALYEAEIIEEYTGEFVA